MGNRWGNSANSVRLYFGGSKITADGYCRHEIKRCLLLGRKVMTNLDSIFKSRDITLLTNVHLVKAMFCLFVCFSSGPVWMWELDCEERWTPKNWCFWTVVLEKSLESPLDHKEIQPVHHKDQPWLFTGKADAEAEIPILWPPHATSLLIGKDPDAGTDWRQEEKWRTEDGMAEWHHPRDAHEFVWYLGVGDGQEGLACFNSWGHIESDMTEWLNWNELLKTYKTF